MIKLKQVSKRFDRTLAVDKISLKIKQGEIVGFLGPNGAGKTTTLRMIAGILPPSEGRVVINRKDMAEKPGVLKQSIGYLPENNPLYQQMTVEEFLKFFLNLKGVPEKKQAKAIDFVVESAGLNKVFYSLISPLSKGYQQRVGLAQALLGKPKILILDEPTEGLDPNQRRETQKLIRQLGKKRTVIVASHVLSEIAKIANRIIIIHQGRIVADGTLEQLAKLKQSALSLEVKVADKQTISRLKKVKGVISVKKQLVLEEIFTRLTKKND